MKRDWKDEMKKYSDLNKSINSTEKDLNILKMVTPDTAKDLEMAKYYAIYGCIKRLEALDTAQSWASAKELRKNFHYKNLLSELSIKELCKTSRMELSKVFPEKNLLSGLSIKELKKEAFDWHGKGGYQKQDHENFSPSRWKFELQLFE